MLPDRGGGRPDRIAFVIAGLAPDIELGVTPVRSAKWWPMIKAANVKVDSLPLHVAVKVACPTTQNQSNFPDEALRCAFASCSRASWYNRSCPDMESARKRSNAFSMEGFSSGVRRGP